MKDEAGEDQRLCAGAAFGQAALDEQLVGASFRHRWGATGPRDTGLSAGRAQLDGGGGGGGGGLAVARGHCRWLVVRSEQPAVAPLPQRRHGRELVVACIGELVGGPWAPP